MPAAADLFKVLFEEWMLRRDGDLHQRDALFKERMCFPLDDDVVLLLDFIDVLAELLEHDVGSELKNGAAGAFARGEPALLFGVF